jgi:hypothetical protein
MRLPVILHTSAFLLPDYLATSAYNNCAKPEKCSEPKIGTPTTLKGQLCLSKVRGADGFIEKHRSQTKPYIIEKGMVGQQQRKREGVQGALHRACAWPAC